MNEVWIVSALRTAVGRYGGALKDTRPDDLVAAVIRTTVERNHLNTSHIGDVLLGCTNQAGEDNRNVARMAVLLSGLPVEVPGVTVNRLCGSGLEAVNQAARMIQLGDCEMVLAGGVESMTRAPFVFGKTDSAYSRQPPLIYDTTLGWRFTNPQMTLQGFSMSLGETAEVVAERHMISREQQDVFALRSQQRAANAIKSGCFTDEILPITLRAPNGQVTELNTDEHPRPDTTLAGLAKLKPAFKPNGTVTAGNSSGINDGAAVLLLVSAEYGKRNHMNPMARILTSSVVGVDPTMMGMGPVPATRKALQRAGLSISQIKLVELNEAFAAQSVACTVELGIDPECVNVNGGAIALGHPLGASGARILTTLVHELHRRGGGYGLATMCIGVGQGIATIIQAM